jgi:hypothetical protein
MIAFIKELFRAYKLLSKTITLLDEHMNQRFLQADEFVAQARAERALKRAQRTS